MQGSQRFADEPLAAVALHRSTNPFASDHRIAIGGLIRCLFQDPGNKWSLSEHRATPAGFVDFPLITKAKATVHGSWEDMGNGKWLLDVGVS